MVPTAIAVGAVGIGVRLLGAVGIEDHWLTVPALGAFPWLVLWAGGTTIAAGVSWRRDRLGRRGVLAAASVAAIGLAVLAPRTVGRPQPPAAGEHVTVGVVNVRIGGADTTRVATLGTDLGLDLLAVVEATPRSSAAMRASRLGTELPAHEHATTDVGGIVLARGTLSPLAGLPHAGGTPDVLWATPGGTEVAVTTVHASAPIGPASTARWRTGLARTPPPHEGASLVLGDLNATVDHATLRELLATGWRDAALEVGAGLAPTYDGLLDRSPGLPMTIDHALVGPGIAVQAVTTHDVPGTDHRMLVARLQLP